MEFFTLGGLASKMAKLIFITVFLRGVLNTPLKNTVINNSFAIFEARPPKVKNSTELDI